MEDYTKVEELEISTNATKLFLTKKHLVIEPIHQKLIDIELVKKPQFSFINPKGFSHTGKYRISLNDDIVFEDEFNSIHDGDNLNGFVSKLTDQLSSLNVVETLDPNGINIVEGIQYSNSSLMTKETVKLISSDFLKKLISPDEVIYIMMKGTMKEFLFCTDKNLYIYKSGFMTGHALGDGIFQMPLKNITNVSVEQQLLSGYFMVSAGGIQNNPKNYWSNNKADDPSKAPNTISLAGALIPIFKQAAQLINGTLIPNSQNIDVNTSTKNENDYISQLRELKSLVDDGIITQDDFEAKKKQILGI